MITAKQMEIRSNIKKYFDLAYDGTPIIVPRKGNRNIVIISEAEYARLGHIDRISSYAEAFQNLKTKADLNVSDVDMKTENLDKLYAISTLKDGWNGNGAHSFPVSLIDKVRSIILDLIIQPEIFPTALQTIQLEYDNSRRDHIEIEIDASDYAEVFFVSSSGTESIEHIKSTATSINQYVGEFYG